MSPALKNVLLLGLFVVIVGLAGFFYMRSREGSSYPDTEASKTTWICDRCGKKIELTAKRFDEWVNSQDKVRRDARFGRQVFFWCTECKAFTIGRAVFCTVHQTWFTEFNSDDGSLRACPLCEKADKESNAP